MGLLSTSAADPVAIRVATFNVSLYGKEAGQVKERLRDGGDRQAEQIAAIVQAVRPDVLLVNELDFDNGETAQLLADLYFAQGVGGQEGLLYPHVIAFPSNTGIDSGLDLDRNGRLSEPGDAWGYGVYPGQYAMAVFSRYPFVPAEVRTFQHFRWSDLPAALRPVDVGTGQPYHTDAIWNQLRLSSKNHVDLPIQVNSTTIHLLASHPTPPVFDGPEDRNGCRNHDEIEFWNVYLDAENGVAAQDDRGLRGGLAAGSPFLIAGDLNADPSPGDGRRQAILKLLSHPRVQDPQPSSPAMQGATADFGRVGNLRVDYVLPSHHWKVLDAGVYWPAAGEPGHDLLSSSDHRLTWVEVSLR